MSARIYAFPTREERKADESAKLLLDMETSPALLIASAIFTALSAVDRLKVQAYCAMVGAGGSLSAIQAVEWLDVLQGQSGSIADAMRRLDGGNA